MHRVRVKICGIKTREIAECAVENGADALGFVFYSKSPRNIGVHDAASVIAALPSFVGKVGVFADSDILEMTAVAAATGIDAIQLHGDESLINMRFLKELREKTGLPIILAVRTERFDAETLSGIRGSDRAMKGWINNYLIDRLDPAEYGGTGKSVGIDAGTDSDPENANFIRRKVILAGGLHPSNIAGTLDQIRPYGVDVSSGVESEKGVKDKKLVKEFLKAAQSWNCAHALEQE